MSKRNRSNRQAAISSRKSTRPRRKRTGWFGVLIVEGLTIVALLTCVSFAQDVRTTNANKEPTQGSAMLSDAGGYLQAQLTNLLKVSTQR